MRRRKMKKWIMILLICLMSATAFAGPVVPDAVMDVMLQYIEDNATRLHIMSAAPDAATGYTDVTASLGVVTIDSGDFTIAAGSTSGRKTTISAQTITATGNGTVTHWALMNAAGDTCYDSGTVTSKVVTNASVYEFESVDLTEIRDAQ